MWIRSQKNHILANVYSLRICKCDIDGCVYYSIHGHYDRYEQELGVYSTKAKAIAVLDEIQEKLEHPYPSKIMPSIGTNCYHLIENNKFYQMPQDDEVDEY